MKCVPGISRFIAKQGEHLPFFLVLSLAAHSGVLILAMVAGLPGRPGTRAMNQDFEAFLQAFRETVPQKALAALELDPKDMFAGMPPLSGGLPAGDRKEIYKKLIESAGAQSEAGLARAGDPLPFREPLALDSGDKVFFSPSAREGKSGEAGLLRRPQKDTLKRLDFFERFEKDLMDVRGGRAIVRSNLGVVEIPEEIYFRECPYEALAASGAGIFRIVQGFPEAEIFAPVESAPAQRGASRRQEPVLPEGVFLIYQKGAEPDIREDPDPAAEAGSPDFPDEEIIRILDGLMGMSEAAQFASFDERYLRNIDPDNPGLARLAREFLYSNLNSVFVLVDDFASAFDGLEELYFKKPVYDAIVAYWRDNPGTRTGAELLFGYASALEFERRTLKRLFEIHPKASRILAGTLGEKGVYKARSKAFVLKRVYDDLEARLDRIGPVRSIDIEDEYILRQKAVYRSLIDAGGEIRDRALFALGKLEWDEGNVEAALQAWRSVASSYSDPIFQRLRPAIPLGNAPDNVSGIRELFHETSAMGNKDLLDRLLKFHKWRNRSPRATKS